MRRLAVFLLLVAARNASAQPSNGPIQDNSFLVEEAYNQEAGIVQHLQQFVYDWKSSGWVWSFTQEFPVPDEKNQLSYTVLLARAEPGAGPATGLGDLALNYRYQLVGGGQASVAVAPRFTIFFPTGSYARSLGAGAAGLQALVPASIVLSDRFVTHWNAGVSWTPRAHDPSGERASLVIPNAGASLVFLAKPTWNLLLESIWVRAESVVGPNRVQVGETFLVSPGVRYAWNLEGGLQIVAGLGVPIGVGPSRGQRSILFYLSFEHPMWKASER